MNGTIRTIGGLKTLVAVGALLSALTASARAFDFKFLGFSGTKSDYAFHSTQTKTGYFRIKIGSASKNDSMEEMEIRAATVLKSARSKRVSINDIATLRFTPKNVGKAIYFEVATGVASCDVDGQETYSGWQVAGIVAEIWQGGKVVKHWNGAKGVPANLRLDGKVEQLRLSEKGYVRSLVEDFTNTTKIYCVDSSRKPVDLKAVLAQFEDVQTESPEKPAPIAKPGDVRSPSDDEGEAEAEAKDEADEQTPAESADDFTIRKICGYEFGSSKSDLTPKGRIRLPRPFRHFEFIRLNYGDYSEALTSVVLESQRRFESKKESEDAMARVVAIFEKKFGIKMEQRFGDAFGYSNSHVMITIYSHRIVVHNRDAEAKEELAAKTMKAERMRKAAKEAEKGEDEDVL